MCVWKRIQQSPLLLVVNDDGHFTQYVKEYYASDSSVMTPVSAKKNISNNATYWKMDDEECADEDDNL